MALSIGHHNFNNSPNQPNHLTENYPLSSEHGIERAGLATRLSQTLKKPVDSEAQYQQQKLSDEGHQANNQDEQFLHSQELDRANTETNAARTVTNDTPYSVFSTKEKKIIIFSASIGTLISPLTTNIYFPALNTLAHDLDVSISKINLSITTYMVTKALVVPLVRLLTDSLDFSGHRPNIHRRVCRFCWKTASVHDRLCRLHCSEHWPCSSKQLPCSHGPEVHSKHR